MRPGRKSSNCPRAISRSCRLPRRCSRGQSVAILDEPLSGLDPMSARTVNAVIRDYAAAGQTVVLSTHQMGLVEALCTRVLMIAHGRAVLYGSLRDIKRQHSSHAVRVLSSAQYDACPLVARVDGPSARRPTGERPPARRGDQRSVSRLAGRARRKRRTLRAAVHAARGHLRGCRRTGCENRMNKVLLIARWEFITTVTRRAYIFAVIAMPLLYGGMVALAGAGRPLGVDQRRARADGDRRPGARGGLGGRSGRSGPPRSGRRGRSSRRIRQRRPPDADGRIQRCRYRAGRVACANRRDRLRARRRLRRDRRHHRLHARRQPLLLSRPIVSARARWRMRSASVCCTRCSRATRSPAPTRRPRGSSACD